MKTHKWLLVSGVLLLGPALGNAPTFSIAQEIPNDKKLFETAVKALEKKNYAAAEKGFNSILADNPGNLKATYYLALAKYQNKEIPEAETLFLTVQKKSPDNPATHYYLGCIAYDRKDWEKSMVEMTEVQKLDPYFSMAAYYLGLIDYQLRKVTEARHYFESAVSTDSSSPLGLYALAYLLLKDFKEPQKAQQRIDQALNGPLDDHWRFKFMQLGKETVDEGASGDLNHFPSFDLPSPPDGHFFFHPAFEHNLKPGDKNIGGSFPANFPSMPGPMNVEDIFKKLSVSGDQKNKIDRMIEFHLNEINVYFDRIHLDEDDLNLELEKGSAGTELNERVEKWVRDRKEAAAAEDRFQQDLANVLTLRQNAQLELLGGLPNFFRTSPGGFSVIDSEIPSKPQAPQP